MALSDTNIALAVRSTLTSNLDLKTASAALSFQRGFALADGTGSAQADKIWDDTRAITASGTDDIDLAGALTDAFGAALTFVTVKGIFVSAAATNTNNVIIGAAAATQFVGPFGANTHTIAVKPGQFFAITAGLTGWAVGAGATDLLRFTNSGAGTSVTYDVVILGTSA